MATETLKDGTQLILPSHTFVDDFETVKRTQEITDEFLNECNDNRIASQNGPMGEFHQFASIPTVIVDQWLREGFNVYEESAKAIMARLSALDLGAFITTTRHI